MNMRGFVFSGLALTLGVLTGCPGDDGGGTGDGTTAADTSTGGGMTAATMTTTMTMTTAMDDGVDDGMMTTTGEPSTTTVSADETSTGEPPADSGTDTGATDTGGTDTGTGGGGLNCDMPADDCETCVCDMCEKQLAACEADPGCVAIRDCAAKNDCTGLDCLGPCGDVINMNGGVAGDSAMLAGAVGACVGESCGKACAP